MKVIKAEKLFLRRQVLQHIYQPDIDTPMTMDTK